MRTRETAFIVLCIWISIGNSFAQAPQAFNYQAVVRNATGELVTEQDVSFRLSIRDGAPDGALLYNETHAVQTNAYGLVTLLVGGGAQLSGVFANIDWGSGAKFLQVEVDPAGGTAFEDLGATQLQSVPYSLYSKVSADGYWGKSNDDIYYNEGNVGIGTLNPLNKLEINGTTLIGTESKAIRLRTNGAITDIESIGSDLGINYQGYGNTVMNVVSGNVGIGLLSPSYKFHVNGTIDADYLAVISNNSTNATGHGLAVRADGGDPFVALSNGNRIFTIKNNGSVMLGMNDPSNSKLQIEGTGAYDAMLRLNNLETNGASFFMGSTNSSWGGGANQNRFVMGHGAPASANIDLAVLPSGYVGIGIIEPTSRLEVTAAAGGEHAIVGNSSEGYAVLGKSVNFSGIGGQSTNGFAGYFNGDVTIIGSLSKGSGSFVIDHPLDPENKLLRHNFVESPENLVIYRGKAKLNNSGEVVVELPDYFEALTKEDEATITLTSIGRPFLTGYEWTGDFKSFKIYGDPEKEVSWVVYADRDDPVIHELGRPVEEEKGSNNKLCEKGKLLYPKAYGFPETAGRDYEMIHSRDY